MKNGFDNAAARRAFGALLVACLAGLAGCGKTGAGSSQVVASVDGAEITETQVNHALERQANLQPAQVESASRKAVAGLVEQAIVVQKARDLKLDRDERVMQDIEAMKRELIVNAYVSRIAEGAAKPSDREISDYYDGNPELFSQRRVYTFQELAIDATPSRAKEIQAQLSALKSAQEIGDYLKAQQIPVRSTQSTLNAENVPQALLKRVSLLKPGQGLIVSNEGGLRVLLLLNAQDSPIAEDKARPAIAAYLLAQNKRLAVQKELKSLEATAKVSYFGKYAGMAASAPAGQATAASTALPFGASASPG